MGDWLWDGSGEPDPAEAELTRALAPLRYQGAPPALPQRRRWKAPAILLLAAAVLLGLAWWSTREPPAAWSCGEGCSLAEGQWLITEESVQLAVADIGTLVVSPGSRLKLLSTSPEQHRLKLERGHVHASVLAPPRLLVVDTPSAQAVDLGCEYDLTVLDDGSSLLIVSSGEVSLEGQAISYVPQDAAALTWPGHGPGIPWFDDAPVAYAEALVAWEREGQRQRLPEILQTSRPRDTLSLWHLLQRVDEAERAVVLARVVALVPEAGLIQPEPLLALQPEALEALKEVLAERWW